MSPLHIRRIPRRVRLSTNREAYLLHYRINDLKDGTVWHEQRRTTTPENHRRVTALLWVPATDGTPPAVALAHLENCRAGFTRESGCGFPEFLEPFGRLIEVPMTVGSTVAQCAERVM